MSELRVNKVTPRSGTTVTLGDSGDSVAIPTGVGFNGFGYRNIIINGDMSIAQRGTSFSVVDNIYTLDRFLTEFSGFGAFTLTQSTDAPDGFGYSLKLDCTTADASPAAGDVFQLFHKIEGQNLQYLKKGTSSAVSTTLSFWVKSNKTGNMQVNLRDSNSRIIGGVYTINSANTWEKKTLTFAGDTSGTLANNNTTQLTLEFPVGSGSNYSSGSVPTSWEALVTADRNAGSTINLADSTANEWYITGVQLEAGTTASDFEFLPFEESVARCYRYYFRTDWNEGGAGHGLGNGFWFKGSNANEGFGFNQFPVRMRTSPTITAFDNAGNSGRIHRAGVGDLNAAISFGGITQQGLNTFTSTGNVLTTNPNMYVCRANVDAEL